MTHLYLANSRLFRSGLMLLTTVVVWGCTPPEKIDSKDISIRFKSALSDSFEFEMSNNSDREVTFKGWRQQDPTSSLPPAAVERLAGAWVNKESGSHIYARVVRGELVAPYCFTGNDELTGVYFAWRRVGDYWFARYRWLDATPIGFTFLRDESIDKLTGA